MRNSKTIINLTIIILIIIAFVFYGIYNIKKIEQKNAEELRKEKIEKRKKDSIDSVELERNLAIKDSLYKIIEEKENDEIRNTIRVTSFYTVGPNSADGCDVIIKFKNISGKRIKYVTFSAYPINAVDDRVGCEIKGYASQRLKYTGPLPSGASTNGYWEDVWYNPTIRKMKIERVVVEFMDNGGIVRIVEEKLPLIGIK